MLYSLHLSGLMLACHHVQAAFHVFGMELLAQLDLDATNQFFEAFFRLPKPYWQGFLASRLSSGKLVLFAAATFMVSTGPFMPAGPPE